MVLASCGYMLQPLIAELREHGVLFYNPYRSGFHPWNPLASVKATTVRFSARIEGLGGVRLAYGPGGISTPGLRFYSRKGHSYEASNLLSNFAVLMDDLDEKTHYAMSRLMSLGSWGR
jgi:hypothetical protein